MSATRWRQDFHITDGRKQFWDKKGCAWFSDVPGVGGLIAKQISDSSLMGPPRQSDTKAAQQSVLLLSLNCRCGSRTVIFVLFCMWLRPFSPSVTGGWADPSSNVTRKQLPTAETFLGEGQRRWRGGGKTRRGRGGECRCWNLEGATAQTGLPLFFPRESSQSSVKGREIRRGEFPYFFFFPVIPRVAVRGDRSERWKPSLCSTCTELSLNLSRCACWISPSPSWMTWWAPPPCLPPFCRRLFLFFLFARVHSNTLKQAVRATFMGVCTFKCLNANFYLRMCVCANTCVDMLARACSCSAALRGCLSRPAALHSSAYVHTWAWLYLHGELHLVHCSGWSVLFLLCNTCELVNQSHMTH